MVQAQREFPLPHLHGYAAGEGHVLVIVAPVAQGNEHGDELLLGWHELQLGAQQSLCPFSFLQVLLQR